MRERFADRLVLVTGAGSGIGRVLCQSFAAEGALVVAADIDVESARRTAAMITEADGRAEGVRLDVTDAESVRSTIASVIETHGPISVLVNNAAIATDTALVDSSVDEWDQVLAVALRGSFLCAQAVLPAMVEAGGGVVLNLGSVNAMTFIGQDAYSAAKAGLESLTRGIAVRHGPHGVRCNLIVPGTIATPAWDSRLERDPDVLDRLAHWYPLRRVGTPHDVAHAALFLASDEASWVTGTSLVVDGGLLAGNEHFGADTFGDR